MDISCGIEFDKDFIIHKIEDLFRRFNAPYEIKKEKTHYSPSYHKNWMLGVQLNKDNQITIGHKKKRNFEALLFNYIQDKKNGKFWPVDQVQYATGLISYYRMVNREDTDKIIQHYGNKYGLDVEANMKADLRAG